MNVRALVRLSSAAAVALAAVACSDAATPTGPGPAAEQRGTPSAARPLASFGATTGSFSFLPPVAAEAPLDAPFDADADPVVEVCRLASADDPAAPCATEVARFARGGDAGHGVVRVDPLEQQYHVNWDTHRCGAAPCVLEAGLYRIRVTDRGYERGAAVIRLRRDRVQSVGGTLRVVTIGSTLPIKFRLTAVSYAPAWSTLVTPTSAPAGGATYTDHAPDHHAIFAMLRSADYQPFSIWRFDLATDTWTLVPTTNVPLGKYRRIVHDPVRHEILTYWDGLGQVWAVSETGGAWYPVGSTSNDDRWYEAAAFWNPAADRITLFGGYGFFAWRNTLWAFDRTTNTWNLAAQGDPKPEPRFAMNQGLDETGQHLYIGGGQGHPSGSQAQGTIVFEDLWRLDLQTNTWSRILPHDATVAPRYAAGLDAAAHQQALYRFGGMNGVNPSARLDALDRLDLTATSPAWVPVLADGVAPSPRWSPGVHYDAPRQRLVIIGGSTATGVVLDAYALSIR